MKKLIVLLFCIFQLNIYSGSHIHSLEDTKFNYIIYWPFIVAGKVVKYLGLNASVKKPSDKCVLINVNSI